MHLFVFLQKFYIVGSNKNRTEWRVLMIDRLQLSELNFSEDPTTYTATECYDLLKRVHDRNITDGGLKFVTKCYGIAGMWNLFCFCNFDRTDVVYSMSKA